ncbi:MAG: LPS assembly protein LptD, partial [Steroidobacteraceae bacterium]
LGVDGDALLKGNVRLRQGASELRADEIEYVARDNGFRVRGNVEYRDANLLVIGPGGTYSQQHGSTFHGARFEFPQRQARGTADEVALQPDGRVDLQGVTYTTCPISAPDWKIRARAITLDPRRRAGTGHNARVDFKGVPLIYLPWISFPLGSQRKSGFLFPDLGNTTRSGLQVAVPYYLNLAPAHDLSLEPMLYQRRGVNLGGEFRYLTERSDGSLAADYLPHDALAGADPLNPRPAHRSWVRLRHQSTLGAGWRVDLHAENVSDPEYFEDFAQGQDGTSVASIERLLAVAYQGPHLGLRAEAQQFQTLDRSLALADRPYASVPRLFASGTWKLGPSSPLVYGFDSEAVNFDRATGVTGWRLDAAPRLALDWSGPGWFLRPGTDWRLTHYALDNVTPGAARSLSRALPTVTLDSGLSFEKFSGAAGERRVTLEPRLLYTYTPYRDQSQLPLFDTTLPDLNLVQLFRTNRYVGADRVSDANQVSVGITSRVFGTRAGNQLLAATLGQIYYLQDPRVALPGELPNRRGSSDIVAQFALSAYRDWNVNLGLQWNPAQSHGERSQVLLQYRPAPDRLVNFAYRFERERPAQAERLEQGELSAAWPLAQRWNLFAKAVYSVPDRKLLERFAGFEYRSCCWKLRLIGRRYVSSRTGESDTAVLLQLELNGLASVGTPADAFLAGAIRGYSPPRAAR